MMYSFETFKVDIVVVRKKVLDLLLDGGAGCGKFVHLHEDFSQLLSGIVYADSPWYKQVLSGFKRQPGRMYKNDIILEVQGKSVAGFRRAEFCWLIHDTIVPSPVTSLTCAAAGVISPSLRDFVARRCVYGSLDHLLQQQIRENVLKLFHAPLTTRLPREGEVDGMDYRFRATERFFEIVARGRMLEYQFYRGAYYGLLLPGEETEWLNHKDWAAFRDRVVPKRSLSFNEAIDQNLIGNCSDCRLPGEEGICLDAETEGSQLSRRRLGLLATDAHVLAR